MCGPIAVLVVGVIIVSIGQAENMASLVTVGMVYVVASCAGAYVVGGLFTIGRRFPLGQRALAALVAPPLASFTGPIIQAFGIDNDAMSHNPSAWALGQELIAMSVFYGTMFFVAFLVLSARNAGREA